MQKMPNCFTWNTKQRISYSQLRAGTLGEDYRTPPGVLQSFSQGAGPGDQLDDARTLEVCFEGVLESYPGESVL